MTFATEEYKETGDRLIGQAIGIFDKLYLYGEEDLKSDEEFWSKHGEFIKNNKRGYGYWIWESYLIKKTMEGLKDGDVLLYLDSGCEIDKRKTDNLKMFFEFVKDDLIIGTENCFEKEYTKNDLIRYEQTY